MHLPHPSMEDFVRAAIGRLQSSERIAAAAEEGRSRPEGVLHDPLRAREGARGLASGAERLQPKDRRSRVGLPGVLGDRGHKTFTQREAAETLGMAEYTVREYCCRRLNEEFVTAGGPQVRPVKCGPALGGHVR